MSALIPLHFEAADVRMVMRDGEPWWVLADVAAALGLSNPTKLANRLEDYQKADLTIREGRSGQRRRMNIINEAGVYALTLNSRKAEAKAFARWLFTDVLPSIRKWGQYPPPQPLLDDINAPMQQPVVPATQAERLLEEIAHWHERNEGFAFAATGIFSDNQLRAIKLMRDGLVKRFSRNGDWLRLMNQGIDLFYVIHGRRQFNENATTLAEALTLAEPEERALLLGRAEAIRARSH